MFGLDTLDLLQEPKPRSRPKLRRGILCAAAILVPLAVIVAGIAVIQNLPGGLENLVMFLTAVAINVLISVALGFMAYHAGRNRMGL